MSTIGAGLQLVLDGLSDDDHHDLTAAALEEMFADSAFLQEVSRRADLRAIWGDAPFGLDREHAVSIEPWRASFVAHLYSVWKNAQRSQDSRPDEIGSAQRLKSMANLVPRAIEVCTLLDLAAKNLLHESEFKEAIYRALRSFATHLTVLGSTDRASLISLAKDHLPTAVSRRASTERAKARLEHLRPQVERIRAAKPRATPTAIFRDCEDENGDRYAATKEKTVIRDINTILALSPPDDPA